MPRHLTTFQSRQSTTTKLKYKQKNSIVFYSKVKTNTQKSTLAGKAMLTTPISNTINININTYIHATTISSTKQNWQSQLDKPRCWAGQATPIEPDNATQFKICTLIFTLAGQAMLENRLQDEQDEERKNPSNSKAKGEQGDDPR